MAHIVRGYHEINQNNSVLRELLPVGEVVEVSDWNMKFMIHLSRCKLSEEGLSSGGTKAPAINVVSKH